MSGPKGYSVRVESAEERLRRQTGEAQARCNVLSDRLEGLRAVVEGVSRCETPQTYTLEHLQSWEQRLQQAINQAENVIGTHRAEARLSAMASTAGLESLQFASLGDLRSAGHGRAYEQVEARQELESKLADILGRASEVDDQAVTDSLAAAAKSVLSLSGTAQTRAWAALESDVARAVKQHRVKRRCLADADREALRVAHVPGPGAETVRTMAARVTDEAGLSELRTQVGRVVAEHERELDAAFVAEQARLALADLGYTVDTPFDVLADAGGFVARRYDLPDHGLQVQVNQSTGKMLTQVVAVPGTTPDDDTAAEEATCADVMAFTAAMAARGVRADLGPHLRPGEKAVEHSLTGTPRARRTTKTRRIEPKAMGLKP